MRRGKRQIHGMIAQPQRLAGVILLDVRHGERRKLLRGVERVRIDEVRRVLLSLPHRAQPLAIIRPAARQNHGAQREPASSGKPPINHVPVAVHRSCFPTAG